MRTMLHSIGATLIALLLTLGGETVTISRALALESTSYQFQGVGTETNNDDDDGSTDSEQVGGSTMGASTLTSTSYQMAAENSPTETSESSTTTTTTGGGGGTSTTSGGGSRGDRAGTTVGGTASSASSELPETGTSSSPSSVRTVHRSVRPAAPTETIVSSSSSSASFIAIDTSLSGFRNGTGEADAGSRTRSGAIHFFDAVDETTAAETVLPTYRVSWILLLLSAVLTGTNATLLIWKKKARTKKEKKAIRRMVTLTILALIAALAAFVIPLAAHAENVTIPTVKSYNGMLSDSAGNKVTTPITLRFSYWKNPNALPTDLTSTGAIKVTAPNFAGFQETHTTTPNARGSFSVNIGSVTPMLNMKNLTKSVMQGLYLQVEVKPAGSADTAYEILDVDSLDDAKDRSQVTPVSFARNADLFDQHDTGTGSYDIPVLDFGGHLPLSTMGSGTSIGEFVIDADNSETSQISLEFGTVLGKKLTYDITNNLFNFNASLQVQGNLTVTGLINGTDISSLTAVSDALKASSGAGLNLNVHGGSYRLNGIVVNYGGGSKALAGSATNYVFFGSGGLTTNLTGFPSDESYIPVAEVATSVGAILSIDDRRITINDDRERTVVSTFNPNYEKASYQGDGADNVGQLSVSHDNISLRNFYVWSSTKTSLQDYDLLLRVPVSADFVRWKSDSSVNPISFTYRTTAASSALNKLDLQIYDTNGTPVTLSGSITNLAATSWSTAQVEFTGTPTWTAGQDMLLRIKFSAKDAYQAHLGSLKLQHVDLLRE